MQMAVALWLLVVMVSYSEGVFLPNAPNYWGEPKVYGKLVSEGVNVSLPQCKKAGINVCQFFLDTGGHHISSISAVLKLSSGEWHVYHDAHHPGRDDMCYSYVHGDDYGVLKDVTMLRKDSKGNMEGSWFVSKKIEGDRKHLLVMQVGFVEGKSNTLLRSRGKEDQKPSSSSSDGITLSGQVWVYGPAGVHWSSDVVCGPGTATRHPEHTSNAWPSMKTAAPVDYAKLAKMEEDRVAELAKLREERKKKLEEEKRKAFDVPTLPGETPLQARWRELKLGVLKRRGTAVPGAVTLPSLAKNLAEEATKDLTTTSAAATVTPNVIEEEGSGLGSSTIAGALLVVLIVIASWVTIRMCCSNPKKHKI